MGVDRLVIISGGQTGVDRVALEVAKAHGVPTTGWAPPRFWTDAGPDPELRDLGLMEHAEFGYPPRTRANVELASVTVLFGDMSSPGCRLTIRCCKELGRPFFVNPDVATLTGVLRRHDVVNFAGNRARTNLSASSLCRDTLTAALAQLKEI